MIRTLFLSAAAALLLSLQLHAAGRTTLSLNGTWQIEESLSADAMPQRYTHDVAVPGLVNQSRPAFPGVDEFDSREQISNRIREGAWPGKTLPEGNGVRRQQRTHFWYRRTVAVGAPREVALLVVYKAQFGTAVWVNGKKAGEHLGCFTAGRFNITSTIRWNAENEIVIRIGADPAQLPPSVPAGTDFEKLKWTPGIYDDAELILADNPLISYVQVVPDINRSVARIETMVENYGVAILDVKLTQSIPGAPAASDSFQIFGNSQAIRTQEIPLAGAHLWTPADPYLYTVTTSTAGDSAATRFGMREFRFDTATKRAYLNGKVFSFRGSNINLHRFFEDPNCGNLPWDDAWTRKLLAGIPRQMHWNSFRLCIGPVPRHWLDIADEAGLLIQYEYPIWTGNELWHAAWDRRTLINEYQEFLRDNWNHPSIILWDAANETNSPLLRDQVIPWVRTMDKSNRAWEDGYTLPSGPDDPVEDHPYLFSAFMGSKTFSMAELEQRTGAKSTNSAHPTGHASFINEYGWLWLNRDGTPTKLTQKVYDTVAGPNATPAERFRWNAYLLAGLTEYWRAHRNFAGVLHFVYLTASFPGAYTSDHFLDVRTLQLEPNFADYVAESFKPLGVYINFWQPELQAGKRKFSVMLANDEWQETPLTLTLTLETKTGAEIAKAVRELTIPANGQQTVELELEVPPQPGDYTLRASAKKTGAEPPTISRRWLRIP